MDRCAVVSAGFFSLLIVFHLLFVAGCMCSVMSHTSRFSCVAETGQSVGHYPVLTTSVKMPSVSRRQWPSYLWALVCLLYLFSSQKLDLSASVCEAVGSRCSVIEMIVLLMYDSSSSLDGLGAGCAVNNIRAVLLYCTSMCHSSIYVGIGLALYRMACHLWDSLTRVCLFVVASSSQHSDPTAVC